MLRLSILMILLLALPAHGQSSKCSTREKIIERLSSKYGESRQSIGMAANNAVVEVYASEKTGTWTITVTTASGMTCLDATGQGFENLSEPQETAGLNL